MTPITIDPRAGQLRRLVGPTPWFVLEELLLGDVDLAARDDRGVVVRASVRTLARTLPLNKDTVARALAILRYAGAVVPLPQANDKGSFGPGTYQVAPILGIHLHRQDNAPSTPPPPTTPATNIRRPSPRTAPQSTQLSFEDAASLDIQHRHRPSSTPQTGSRPHPLSSPSPKQDDALAPPVPPAKRERIRDGNGNGTDARKGRGRC